MGHPSYINKNTYDFVYKIAKLVIPDECLLIKFDVERTYTNIDYAKGIHEVSDALHFRGPLFPRP